MLYLLSFVLPTLCLMALFSKSTIILWLPVLAVFVLTPALDLLPMKMKRSPVSGKTADRVLYTVCAFYLMVFALFLTKLPGMSLSELVIKSASMGLCGVLFGINGAHELGHRLNKGEQFFSKVLLFSTSYLHFFIEHNRGHHKNIATPNDPATSRLNENIYAFLPRSTIMSWISAFKIEQRKKSLLKNKVVHYAVYQLAFCLLLFTLHPFMLYGFLLHSTVSVFLLESVNYIEHYGLLRKKVNGRYEKVGPQHSWNSDHFFSSINLFEVTRHSDHHALAGKPYHELESIESAPQMPTGYAGMLLLAFIPALWFKVMNPRVLAMGH